MHSNDHFLVNCPARRTCLLLVSGIVACVACLWQASTADAAEGINNLVAADATVVKLSGGFKFTEGPAANSDGDVYFSDIPNNRIHIWTVDGKLTTFRENSGQANGLYFDHAGNLVACEGGNRQVTSITMDGKVTVLAEKYEGKRFCSPNDLWIHPNGGIYFTDPRYGSQDGLEIDGFHVYYITPDQKVVRRVLDNLVKPNGVVGTKDGKFLYVTDPGDAKTYRYAIQGDGTLTDRKLHAAEGSDGMTLDEQGNLYLTRGGVQIYSPNGEKLGTIETPEAPANVCFGGKDGKTLFITARTGLYSIRMAVAGQPSAHK